MNKTITKSQAIQKIRECLDRHSEADSLDSCDTVTELLNVITGRKYVVSDEGEILTDEANDDDLRTHIVKQVRQGFRWGISPNWNLELDGQDFDEFDLVADMIESGYREGYSPRWQLKYE